MQHGSIETNALKTTRTPYHLVPAGKRYKPIYGKTPDKVSPVNEKEGAQKTLQDFYHNEELRNARLRRLYPATNTSVSENSKTQPKKLPKHAKPGNDTNPVYTLWFSCNNVNTCVILTASVASLLSVLLVLCLVGLCLHCRKSRNTFSPEEWWKQPAATPLLLIPSMQDDDQVPKQELTRLRKYLKKYMSITHARENRAADNMPDIPEERDLDTKSLNPHNVKYTTGYRQNSAMESRSIFSELSNTMDNSLNQRPSDARNALQNPTGSDTQTDNVNTRSHKRTKGISSLIGK